MRPIAKNETMIRALENRFKGQDTIHVFDRDKNEGRLIVSAEHLDTIGGFPVADYYDASYWDPKEERHESGINRKLKEFVEECGWGLEWDNPGCLSLYKDF